MSRKASVVTGEADRGMNDDITGPWTATLTRRNTGLSFTVTKDALIHGPRRVLKMSGVVRRVYDHSGHARFQVCSSLDV
jgi:hypothetical protein